MATLTVVTTTSCEPKLNGALSRWMIEIKHGVYVGRLSATVRKNVWDLVRGHVGTGSAVIIQQENNDQGFTVKHVGEQSISFIDMEGIILSYKTKTTKQISQSSNT